MNKKTCRQGVLQIVSLYVCLKCGKMCWKPSRHQLNQQVPIGSWSRELTLHLELRVFPNSASRSWASLFCTFKILHQQLLPSPFSSIVLKPVALWHQEASLNRTVHEYIQVQNWFGRDLAKSWDQVFCTYQGSRLESTTWYFQLAMIPS